MLIVARGNPPTAGGPKLGLGYLKVETKQIDVLEYLKPQALGVCCAKEGIFKE